MSDRHEMDGQEQLFALFWKCVATIACTAILTIGGCVANDHRLQAEVMEKASNSALVKCAIDASQQNQSIFCNELAKGAK